MTENKLEELEVLRELFIVRGVSGAGKTTVAESIVGTDNVASADNYFYKLGGGEYAFDFTKLGAAHGYCKGKVESLMKKDTPKIAVANTTTKTSDMKPYMKLAETYGYKVHVIVVENHHGGENQHGVPEITLNRMAEQLMNSIKLR